MQISIRIAAAAALVALVALVAAPARASDEAPPMVIVQQSEPEPYRAVSQPFTTEAPARRHKSRLGVLFGVVGVPQPIGAELVAKIHDVFAVGVGVGTLPAPVGSVIMSAAGISGGKLNASAVEGEARLFPFRGSFWLGAALGRMSLSASGLSRGSPVAVDITTMYAAPRLGWLAQWESGFSLGLDLGLQIPMGPDVQVQTGSAQSSTIESLARSLAALPLPTASVRLGFLL